MSSRTDELEQEINRLEEEYQDREVPVVCLNHVTEIYYYEYFVNQDEYKFAKTNLNKKWKELAEEFEKEENWNFAKEAYKKALVWNPVDLEAYFGICNQFIRMNDLELLLEYTKKAYRFCVTRATLARYYRNLGFYYLETYQPELAQEMYQYSNLYFHSRQADSEIKYLEEALKRSYQKKPVEELVQILKKAGIPVGPDPVSLGLTYEAGKQEEAAGRIETAKECYLMVYDITQDEEIREKLRSI